MLGRAPRPSMVWPFLTPDVRVDVRMAQQCRHVARRSYLRSLGPSLSWNLSSSGGGLFDERPNDSNRSLGRFRFLSDGKTDGSTLAPLSLRHRLLACAGRVLINHEEGNTAS